MDSICYRSYSIIKLLKPYIENIGLLSFNF